MEDPKQPAPVAISAALEPKEDFGDAMYNYAVDLVLSDLHDCVARLIDLGWDNEQVQTTLDEALDSLEADDEDGEEGPFNCCAAHDFEAASDTIKQNVQRVWRDAKQKAEINGADFSLEPVDVYRILATEGHLERDSVDLFPDLPEGGEGVGGGKGPMLVH